MFNLCPEYVSLFSKCVAVNSCRIMFSCLCVRASVEVSLKYRHCHICIELARSQQTYQNSYHRWFPNIIVNHRQDIKECVRLQEHHGIACHMTNQSSHWRGASGCPHVSVCVCVHVCMCVSACQSNLLNSNRNTKANGTSLLPSSAAIRPLRIRKIFINCTWGEPKWDNKPSASNGYLRRV